MNEQQARTLTVEKLKSELLKRNIEYTPKDRKADLLGKLLENINATNNNTTANDGIELTIDNSIDTDKANEIPPKNDIESDKDIGLQSNTIELTIDNSIDTDKANEISPKNESGEDIGLQSNTILDVQNQSAKDILENIDSADDEEKTGSQTCDVQVVTTVIDEPNTSVIINKTTNDTNEKNIIAENIDSKNTKSDVSKKEAVSESTLSNEIPKEIEEDSNDLKVLSKTENEIATPVTIRIDNFQRPLHPNALVTWLEEQSQLPSGTLLATGPQNLWLSLPLKTHCYINFPNREAALICIQNITGKQFPSTSSLKLTAVITKITAEDAAAGAAEAKLSPSEFLKYYRLNYDVTNSSSVNNTKVAVGVENNKGRNTSTKDRKLSLLNVTGSVMPSVDVLRKALTGSTGSPRNITGSPRVQTSITATVATSGVNDNLVTKGMTLITGNFEEGFTTRKHRNASTTVSTSQHSVDFDSITTGKRGRLSISNQDQNNQSHDIVKKPKLLLDDSNNNKNNKFDNRMSVGSNDNEKEHDDSSTAVSSHAEEEGEGLILDQLFKKTKNVTPHLYWTEVDPDELKSRIQMETENGQSYAKTNIVTIFQADTELKNNSLSGGSNYHGIGSYQNAPVYYSKDRHLDGVGENRNRNYHRPYDSGYGSASNYRNDRNNSSRYDSHAGGSGDYYRPQPR